MSVPTRHPQRPGPVPGAIRLLAGLLGLGEPDQDQWRRLGERLTVGDEAADRLVEWMLQAGMAETRPLFERAAARGIAEITDAPAPLREFFELVETVPDWVDWDLVRRGERAMRRSGADGMYIARDVSLLGGYQFSGFNKTLVRTGALEKGSNKRFAETMQWAMDVISENGMDLGGVGYRSTLRVRLIHAMVRRHVAALPDWRGADWGLPINQTDMAATLVGALIAPSAGGIGMGLLLSPADYAGIAHLTRYVGWLIGVDDEWLPRDYRDGIRVLFHTLTALAQPDDSTRALAVPMAQDPMGWHFANLSGIRRRLARAQHLSVTSAFLGPRAMRALGLPAYVLPWYPALRLPVNVLRSLRVLARPELADADAARGEREQKALLRTMIGDAAARIGDSAAHVVQVA
ncbi:MULTISPECIES: oxygenase MpaB family protein [Mycolicibacterium]|uniref:oxygenase MpaB family protein n=1 Tax=Mycolicibacterium TaxID=1866885 RepID=UPI001F4CBF0A|nr:oxygenase MpaB family protein [Mycolicibacterium neoaurum]